MWFDMVCMASDVWIITKGTTENSPPFNNIGIVVLLILVMNVFVV